VSLYSPKASVGQTLLNDIAHDPAHPLHPMLWPAVDEAALAAPYVPPAQTTLNEGDGHLRADDLAAFESHPGPITRRSTTSTATCSKTCWPAAA
jgi:hypothetical protein